MDHNKDVEFEKKIDEILNSVHELEKNILKERLEVATEESIQSLLDKLQNVIDDSEKLFESKITYISAGALVLSLNLVDKVIPLSTSHCKWLIILSWFLFGFSLILNLWSHRYSSSIMRQFQEWIKDYKTLPVSVFNEKSGDQITKINKNINRINRTTYWSLLIGLLFLILFTSHNIINYMETKSNKRIIEVKIDCSDKDAESITKGLSIPTNNSDIKTGGKPQK